MPSSAEITVTGRSERLDTGTRMDEVFTHLRPYTRKLHQTVSYSSANGTSYTVSPPGEERLLFVQVLESTGDDVEVTWTGDSTGLVPCTAILLPGRVFVVPFMVELTSFTLTIGTTATIEFLTLGIG